MMGFRPRRLQAMSLPVLVLLNFNRAYTMHDPWNNALSGGAGWVSAVVNAR